jgi:hypothetical protein
MTPSLMPTVSSAPAENPVHDCANPIKPERTSPIMAEQPTQPTSIPMTQTGEVLLEPGDTLPDHLMQLLREWHRQSPKRKPPCSYQIHTPGRRTILFSRTFERSLSLSQILVASPVRYAMVVLRGEQEPAKFVRCVTGAGVRTFFKAWLGGDKFEDRACAVRVSDPNSENPRDLVTEDLWEAADLKSPLPLSTAPPGPGAITIPTLRRRTHSEAVEEDNSSTGSSTSESEEEYETPRTRAQKRRRITGPEQQPSEENSSRQDSSKQNVSEKVTAAQNRPSQRKLAEQNGNQSGKIDFKLVAPSSFSGSRSFTVEQHNDGKSLFKRCRDFFRVFGEMAPILICKISGDEVRENPGPEMIFDAQDMAHLLAKLQEQAAGGKRLTVTVEIKDD